MMVLTTKLSVVALLCTPSSAFGLVVHAVLYQIFNNTAFGGIAIESRTAASLVAPLQHVEPWQSVRIQASLIPESKQWLLFGLRADEGYARLWVDHHLLVDEWCNGTSIEARYLPVPFLTESSLLQLELTFWGKTATIIELTANKTKIPTPWFHATVSSAQQEYQRERAIAERGWNTWLSRDMLTHALLPHGIALSMALHVGNATTSNVGAPSCDAKEFPVKHGLHDTRGEYTELEEVWVGDIAKYRIESAATMEGSLVIVITSLVDVYEEGTASTTLHVPEDFQPRYCETAVARGEQALSAHCPGFQTIFAFNLWQQGTFTPLEDGTGILKLPSRRQQSAVLVASTLYPNETHRSLGDPVGIVATARRHLLDGIGTSRRNETKAGLLTAIAWNVVYSPYEGIITPVFRGSPWVVAKPHDYVLFEWDTYFASIMASYANDQWTATNNIVRMTLSLFYQGFVPGFWNGLCGEMDKSKPPIAGMALEFLVKRYPSLDWVVDLLLPNLVEWNRWCTRERMQLVKNGIGLIAPGSIRENLNLEINCADAPALHAAKCETGLDNSPLYDGASFVADADVMDQVDVGMSALYAYDCVTLSRLAYAVAQTQVAQELEDKAAEVIVRLNEELWNEEEGIYLNRKWTTGEWIPRGDTNGVYPKAPTSVYPWLVVAVSPDQADAMIERYLANSSEFSVNPDQQYGLPSISRSSSTFNDNSYWRGRSWGPMNFLVYCGLLQYSSPLALRARRDLSAQSEAIFLVEWKKQHRIMENYNSITAEGCDKGRSANPFYHWGALNALIPLMEAGILGEVRKDEKTSIM
jgi:putative isomerase